MVRRSLGLLGTRPSGRLPRPVLNIGKVPAVARAGLPVPLSTCLELELHSRPAPFIAAVSCSVRPAVNGSGVIVPLDPTKTSGPVLTIRGRSRDQTGCSRPDGASG